MSRIPTNKEALTAPVKNAKVVHTSGVGRMTLTESFQNVAEFIKQSPWNIFVAPSGRDGVPVRVQWVEERLVGTYRMNGWELIKEEEVEQLESFAEFTPQRKPFGRPGFVETKNGYLFNEGQFGMWITEARYQVNFQRERAMFESDRKKAEQAQKVESGRATLESATEEVEMDLRDL